MACKPYTCAVKARHSERVPPYGPDHRLVGPTFPLGMAPENCDSRGRVPQSSLQTRLSESPFGEQEVMMYDQLSSLVRLTFNSGHFGWSHTRTSSCCALPHHAEWRLIRCACLNILPAVVRLSLRGHNCINKIFSRCSPPVRGKALPNKTYLVPSTPLRSPCSKRLWRRECCMGASAIHSTLRRSRLRLR